MNISELPSLINDKASAPKPLTILRGEYAITSGITGLPIASPNAKNGTLLILSDPANAATAMAHLDNNQDFEINLLTILRDLLTTSNASLADLKCDLMGTDSHDSFEEILKEKGIHQISRETWTGSHPYNVEVSSTGIIATNNDGNKTRELLTDILFTKNGEARVSMAMNGKVSNSLKKIEAPSLSNKPTLVLKTPASQVAVGDKKDQIKKLLQNLYDFLLDGNFLNRFSIKSSAKKFLNKFTK